jgi:hypothetical protein
MAQGQKTVTNNDIVDLYIKNGYNLSEVARKVKMCPMAMHARKKHDTKLAELLKEAEELRLDIAESVLDKLVISENMNAVKFYLDRKGKERGFGEKVEVITGEKKFAKIKFTEEGKTIELT